MIASGAPITEVQHRLGHANPAITLLVYSHFLKHAESDVADRLADALLNSPLSAENLKKRSNPPLAQLHRSSKQCDVRPLGDWPCDSKCSLHCFCGATADG